MDQSPVVAEEVDLNGRDLKYGSERDVKMRVFLGPLDEIPRIHSYRIHSIPSHKRSKSRKTKPKIAGKQDFWYISRIHIIYLCYAPCLHCQGIISFYMNISVALVVFHEDGS